MLCCFLAYINMNQPQVYMCTLPLEPSSHPDHHGHPLNSIPFLQVVTEHRVELPVTYGKFPLALYFTFGNVYVSKLLSLSHPLLPLLCPQVCTLCLHLCSGPANSLISIIFLDSIYMCKYTVFFFLIFTYFTLYNRLQVHPSHWN